MIYTLTLNPSLDYYIYMDDFSEGGIVTASNSMFRAGGKGVNVSVTLKNLEFDTVSLGFSGGFSGDFIKKELKGMRIENYFIDIEADTRVNIKLAHNGKETEIMGKSPIVPENKLEELLKSMDMIDGDDILVLSGSLPGGLEDDIYVKIAGRCHKNTRIVLDTRGNLMRKNMYPYFLVKPNIHELEEMFGTKIDSDEKIAVWANCFLEQGVENIIVSKGADGAVFITKDGAYTATAPEGTVIKSVGAGDSMVAGFIAGTKMFDNIVDSFGYSVACGSASAFSNDSIEAERVTKLLPHVDIKQIF